MSTNTQTLKKWNRLVPFAGLLLVLGLILSFTAVKSHPAPHFEAAAPSVSAGALRGRAADAARYEAQITALLLRGRAADAARYETMAQYFVGKEAANLQRSRAADAARYEAMAQYFAAR